MNSKERLLKLMQLLYTQTDEEHPMTTSEIVDYFLQRGEVIHRQTVKAEIELLCDFGMTQAEFNNHMNNPDLYAWQNIHDNRSHAFEVKH